MKFALNYSPVAHRLLESGQIAFDLWKCPPRPDLIALAQTSGLPLYVHFPFDAGDTDFDQADWEAVEKLMDETGTSFVNVHLNARRSFFPAAENADDGQAALWVRDRFLRNVGLMAARFGAERVIAENVIYRGSDGPFLRASVEPDVICAVMKETGCGLLLDTAHAQMTCLYTHVPVAEYIAALPTHSLRELHITGVAQDEAGKWRDSMPLTDADYSLAREVLHHIHIGKWPVPNITALEYGGVGPSYEWRTSDAVLTNQVPLLRELVRGKK